jgi:hypothetical protein
MSGMVEQITRRETRPYDQGYEASRRNDGGKEQGPVPISEIYEINNGSK